MQNHMNGKVPVETCQVSVSYLTKETFQEMASFCVNCHDRILDSSHAAVWHGQQIKIRRDFLSALQCLIPAVQVALMFHVIAIRRLRPHHPRRGPNPPQNPNPRPRPNRKHSLNPPRQVR